MDIVQQMAAAMAKLEKKPTEAETSVAASESEQIPPLPLAQFPHVSIATPVVGQYDILAPRMPVGLPLPRPVDSEAEMTSCGSS